MTSFQSELGSSEGVAEELAESQRSISIAEFFEKNKHMLGFDSEARALVTAVKEAVDNSLTWSTPFVYREEGETKHAPIGEVVDHQMETNPDSVEIRRGGDLQKLRVDGMEALAFDSEYDVDFRRVSSVFRHRVNSEIYRITVEGGREVELTDYHSVFVLRDGAVKSVETSDLSRDDHVVFPDTVWESDPTHRIDLIEELFSVESGVTESVGLYGIEHLLSSYDDEIRELVDRDYRLSDFRKCDRLPLWIVAELDLDRDEYADCTLGCRYGRHRIPAVLDVSDALAEFLGLYVAEGCVTGSDGALEKLYLSLGAHEKELISYAEGLVESVFGIEPSTVEAHESAVNVTIPSKIVALVMSHVFQPGPSATEKRIPRFIFDFPRYKRERFFIGYAAGDGYPTDDVIALLRENGSIRQVERNQITVATSSDRLSSGMRYLLSSVGYDATHEFSEAETREINGNRTEFGSSHLLHVRTNQSHTSKRRLPADRVLESVDDAKLAYNLDGRQTRVEVDHAIALADGGHVNFKEGARELAESDLAALPITDIERVEYEGEWVYDVSVPGDENFMAGTAPLACHNSLDAAEEAGIKPDIYVEIDEAGDYYRLVVEDNGPGVTKEQVPKIFGKLLYGSRFHKREQARGQQGIGISAAVLYSQLTSGKPARIITRTKGSDQAQYFELTIDTETNEPEISDEGETTWDRPHGTRIELEMEANMRSRGSLHEYVEQTAVVNPHARVELREPSAHKKFERVDGAELPPETEEIRPHPHGVELGTLIKMLESTDSYSISGFLQGEFTRVGGKTADSVIDNFRDRHYGREMAWRPPQTHEDASVADAVEAVVANKGADATAEFARRLDDAIEGYDRVAHHQVDALVDDVAGDVEDKYDKTFGSTVREKAVEAAWEAVVRRPGDGAADGDGPGETPEALGSDLYALVGEATSTRKDDATVEGVADRLASKFDEAGQRHRVTRDNLEEFVRRSADATEEYDDATFGETARENVVETLWEAAVRVPDDPPKVTEVARERDTASELLDAMRATDIIAPPTNCLAPITADLIEEGLRKEFDADFYAASTRDAAVHGGDPFIVEAGIAYGGELEAGTSADVMRFANRVPLVYQRGACATTDVVKSINWRNYNLNQPGGSGVPTDAAVVMVHVASTNVPFTSESKDAVANIPELESEVELAVREAARELKSYLKKRRSRQQRRKKQDKLATILPEMAEKLSEVTGREALHIDDSLARIMNNVLVEREVADDTVRLVVENNADRSADLDLTEVVTGGEPALEDGDANVVEMDGEWFLKWSVAVSAGETATLTYDVGGDASFDLSVDGIEDEKLTVNT
jgi:DNA topoisomerase-6 subunit B